MRRLAAASAALLALSATLLVAPAAHAAAPAPTLVINEVESDGDSHDWVELYNTSDQSTDASGLRITDDKRLDRTLTLPAGTVVAAHGFLTVDVDDKSVWGDSAFGLGKADEVHLYWDGTEIDGYSYASSPSTTWGACPDGSKHFAQTATATKGAPNVCASDPVAAVRINEIESDAPNKGSDWVELTNIAAATVDASGLILKDDGDKNDVVVPSGTTIPAGGYVAIDVKGLGGADSARLFSADGATLIDSYTWTAHADETYGRCPDGTGAFAQTEAATRGAANMCPQPAGASDIRINEIESNGDDKGDWVELYNMGSGAVEVGSWIIRDNDDSHTLVIPAGSTIPAGGFASFYTEDLGGFGLGVADSVRLYLADGKTLVDSHSWTSHAPTTYGRCPDGTGEFVATVTPTRNAANACVPVRINEVESDGDAAGDWIELVNVGSAPVDLGGYVVKDDDDAHAITLPQGTTLAAGARFVVVTSDKAAWGSASFGLGSADSARLFTPKGALVDAYTWTAHAATTYARCPDGTGAFATSASATKGAPNDCGTTSAAEAWPGAPEVSTIDDANLFGGDMSGLFFQNGALWAVNNGTGQLYRLTSDGGVFRPAAQWTLRYGDGTGAVDSEGVTLVGDTVYVASERNNADSKVSRASVLAYTPQGTSGELSATAEWNLTPVLGITAANGGLEGIAWIPDTTLVAGGFVDASTGAAYAPSQYAGHGTGLFFVGVESLKKVFAVALLPNGQAKVVATIDPGLNLVAEVAYDAATGQLWAVCDEACNGESAVFALGTKGSFELVHRYANPAGMLDTIANEGFAFGACVNGSRAVYYADDANTGGHALRQGALNCVTSGGGDTPGGGSSGGGDAPGGGSSGGALPATGGASAPAEQALTDGARGGVTGPSTATPGQTVTVQVGTRYAGQTVFGWVFSTPIALGSTVVSAAGAASFTLPASLPAGAHRIAVTDASGSLIGWTPVSVRALAATGGDDARGWIPASLLVVGLGGALVLLARRPRAHR